MTSLGLLVVRSHIRRHWRSLLFLGIATGLLGGVTVASFAGARRTDTAYDRLIESTGFPDAAVQLGRSEPSNIEAVRDTVGVERTRGTSFTVGMVGGASSLTLVPVQASVEPGTFHRLVEGREVDATDPGEVTVSERMAKELHLEVGDVLEHVALTDVEWRALLEDDWDGSATGLALDLHVVGITRTPLDAVTDGFPTIFGTPAYHALLEPGSSSPTTLWLDVAPATDLDEVVRSGGFGADPLTVLDFRETRQTADEAVSVLTRGLLVLGIVGVAATVAGGAQLGARHADRVAADLRVLSGLGLTRRELRFVTVATTAPAAALAMATATAFAIAVSVVTPVGVARGLEPTPGLAVHLGATAAGAVLIGLLCFAASIVAARPGVRARGSTSRTRRPSRVPSALVAGPVAAVTRGLAEGGGRAGASRHVAAAGVGIGIAGLLGVVVFGASLNEFVTDPAGWGEIADHEVNLPAPVRDETLAALESAEEVEAFAEVVGGEIEVAGTAVPAFWVTPRRGSIDPTVVSGRLPASASEIALGPAALDRLALAIGDPVEVDGEVRTIVGSALGFVTDGGGFAESAVLGGEPSIPATERYTQAIVRFAPGVDPAIAGATLYGDLEYGTFLRPVSVTNLAELEPILPLVTAVVCAVGLASLIHLAVAVGTRSRRDLAVLRAIGMRRSELTRAVVSATVLLVASGALLTLPLVVLLVRATWRSALEATDLTVGIQVPVSSGVIAVAVVLLVGVVGAVAGRHASRMPAAQVLRSE